MSTSRAIADRLAIDIHSLVLAMMDAVSGLRGRTREEREAGQKILDQVQEDLADLAKDYLVIDALGTHYHLDFKPGDLRDCLAMIRDKKYEEALGGLSAINQALKEKIDDVFGEDISERGLCFR